MGFSLLKTGLTASPDSQTMRLTSRLLNVTVVETSGRTRWVLMLFTFAVATAEVRLRAQIRSSLFIL
uniref:Uncharacterized protein n=1 Tax=Yersinia enterocolitica TaxID=630 RepID=B0RL13_YEREN|nr:hypothetical protein [Yersinia enterocolitica]